MRRRRRCVQCGKRFTTYEHIELNHPAIVKKNGERETFDEAKLRSSMMLALRKRPVPMESVDNAIRQITEKLLTQGEREVPSSFLGELVMRELQKLDKIAFIRFASVYRSFDNLAEFHNVIEEVTKDSNI